MAAVGSFDKVADVGLIKEVTSDLGMKEGRKRAKRISRKEPSRQREQQVQRP